MSQEASPRTARLYQALPAVVTVGLILVAVLFLSADWS